MKTGFRIGDFELTWLNGGRFELDGGAMFGVVPKVLWQKKYPADADNCIPLLASPILVRTASDIVLIESGIGNKLSEKQRKIYRVREEWAVLQELAQLGIGRDDVTHVVLTHYDWDHAGGVVIQDDVGGLALTFPRAKHVIHRKEWEDVLNPNIRSVNAYWPVNIGTLKENGRLTLTDGTAEVAPGIRVIHTGGHVSGHQIIVLESRGEKAFHLADLLPTHAHANPLWIMAYDNHPLDTIALKERWLKQARSENAWLTFYHDVFMHACKLDDKGNVVKRWPDGER